MNRILIFFGVILIVLGLAWPLFKQMGLGHLPGDFIIRRENYSIYAPITTSLVISIVLTLLVWIFRRMH